MTEGAPMLRSMFRTSLLVSACAGLLACGSSSTSGTTTSSPAPARSTSSAPVADMLGGGTGPAARIGAEEISFADLDEAASAQMVRLRTQAYDIRKQTLQGLIDDRLLAAEAKKLGVTSDELVKTEVTDKVAEPSDEEAKAYFDKNPPRGQVDFEKIKPRVKAFMKRQSEQEVRAAFISKLRDAAGVQIFLEPMRFDVTFDGDDPIYGSKDAPVMIVEFSDFQCPYCSRVNDTVEQVKKEYGDKVALVFRDFPLPMHPEAPKASEAGQCANEEGKFWGMHDLMFANQQALKDEDLKGYAKKLGLDETKFAACLDSGKWAAEVEEDKAAGSVVGVTGTPAFFINGQFLNGARPFEQFKEIIDAELSAKGLL